MSKRMNEDEKIFIERLESLNRLCTGHELSEWEKASALKMYRLQEYQPLSKIVMERKGSIGLSHRKGWLKKINYDLRKIKRALRKNKLNSGWYFCRGGNK